MEVHSTLIRLLPTETGVPPSDTYTASLSAARPPMAPPKRVTLALPSTYPEVQAPAEEGDRGVMLRVLNTTLQTVYE